MKLPVVHRITTLNWEAASLVNIPHVIAMVGLPARGKSHIGKKITRYLNWIGIKTRVFNLGEYRRHSSNVFQDNNFFRNDNADALRTRMLCALEALNDMCSWLQREGQVAVLDATNTTVERRKLIYEKVVVDMGFKLMFVESICDDPAIIERNILDVKVNGPDYRGVDKDVASRDFMERIRHYEQQYVSLDEISESHMSFVKIFNTGQRVVVHQSNSYIQSRIVYYIMNLHITPRSIYLTRNGESEHILEGRIGGDSDLTDNGRRYSRDLATFVKYENVSNLRVWTSWLKRSIQTASDIDAEQERWKALNEIDAGKCEEMTYEEIKEKYPDDFAARDQDKYFYRYPRGESYSDLVARLEPVIMELERQENVLIISHQAVLRCILAYFLDKSADELPYLEVPLHAVIKLTPVASGCNIQYTYFPIPATDTHRNKPDVPGFLEDKFKRK